MADITHLLPTVSKVHLITCFSSCYFLFWSKKSWSVCPLFKITILVMHKIFVFKMLQSIKSTIAQQIQSTWSCLRVSSIYYSENKVRIAHTLPSLLKNFSTSAEVTLVDKPVTYKLFPGLVASTDGLLE